MRKLNNISIEPNVAPGIDLLPLIGETAWHSVTLDPSIAEVSKAHFETLVTDLTNHDALRQGLKVLEVAAYAHITGYILAERFKADVTLFDVSSSTLRLGRNLAFEHGLPTTLVRRVAGDFHELPFDTGEFDVVYISSALHHTWRWRRVLAELVRVTKTGGHLFLENEPCRRELCFYRFRTNRQEDLTVAETFLDQQGLLRTVAEPYLGSRSEQLFGMTENQEIRLHDLLGQLSLSSEVVHLKASPQICMGTLENTIDRALSGKAAALALDFVRSTISSAFEQARVKTKLEAIEASLLPEVMHVEALVTRICALLEKSDWGRGEFMIAASGSLSPISPEHLSKLLKPLIDNDSNLARDLDRATLFGAAIKIIACKRRELGVGRAERIEAIAADGVDLMFAPEVFQLMDPRSMLFPEMQRAKIEDIVQALGPDWHLAASLNGVRMATPLVSRPGVQTVPVYAEHVVVFARVYGVGKVVPWTLWLTVDGERRANLVFDKSGSGLLIASVSNAVGPIRIEFEAFSGEVGESPSFNLAHLGVLRVPA